MEEARLMGMLRRRLGQGERKVSSYREELVEDFQLFYLDLLRDVPPLIASKVRRSLTRSLSAGDYPILNPELPYLFGVPDLPESPPPTVPSLSEPVPVPVPMPKAEPEPEPVPVQRHPSTPTTPTTVLQHSPDSPQSREMALQGLFTPSYLPLLESSPQQSKPRPAAHQPPPINVLLPAPGIVAVGQGATMREQPGISESPGALSMTPQSPFQHEADRASTDDTNSSVVSDRSEPKTPRSALRRSSSSSKTAPSPRRVRFDFMGAEVLPTASPQPTDFMTPRPYSPEPSAEPVSADIMLGDGDEEQPPPRKISSSEALRALSRAPLDESTVWTVVNANPDEILVEQADLELTKTNASQRDRSDLLPATPDPPPATGPLPIRSSPRLGSLNDVPEEDAEEGESSEEEFLSMAKPKSLTNQKAPSSPSPSGAEDASAAAGAKQNSDGKMANDSQAPAPVDDLKLDEEDMFYFEAGGLSAPPKPKSNSLLMMEEKENIEALETETDSVSEIRAPLYATSPAVPIGRQSMLSGPVTPTRAKFQSGSVGSYKGRPVIMPVVRDPEVHAQAASLGQFNTFVGGLDGRSGMDEGDLSSFRASVANTAGFSSTPRSFTERLMMEEAQLQRANHSDANQIQ